MEIFSSSATPAHIAPCEASQEFATGPAVLLHPLRHTFISSSNLHALTEVVGYRQGLKERAEASIFCSAPGSFPVLSSSSEGPDLKGVFLSVPSLQCLVLDGVSIPRLHSLVKSSMEACRGLIPDSHPDTVELVEPDY